MLTAAAVIVIGSASGATAAPTGAGSSKPHGLGLAQHIVLKSPAKSVRSRRGAVCRGLGPCGHGAQYRAGIRPRLRIRRGRRVVIVLNRPAVEVSVLGFRPGQGKRFGVVGLGEAHQRCPSCPRRWRVRMPRRISLRTDAIGVTAIYQFGDLDAAAVNYLTGLRLR